MIRNTNPFVLTLDGVPVLAIAPLDLVYGAVDLGVGQPTRSGTLSNVPITSAHVVVSDVNLNTLLEADFEFVAPENHYGLVLLSGVPTGQILVSGYIDVAGQREPFRLVALHNPGVEPGTLAAAAPLAERLKAALRG